MRLIHRTFAFIPIVVLVFLSSPPGNGLVHGSTLDLNSIFKLPEIPDQEATVHRLFYFRLPQEWLDMGKCKLQLMNLGSEPQTEIDNDRHRSWISYDSGTGELLALPQNPAAHFLSIKLLDKDDSVMHEDIFALIVGEEPATPPSPCGRLVIKEPFKSLGSLWTFFSYLLQHQDSPLEKLKQFRIIYYKQSDSYQVSHEAWPLAGDGKLLAGCIRPGAWNLINDAESIKRLLDKMGANYESELPNDLQSRHHHSATPELPSAPNTISLEPSIALPEVLSRSQLVDHHEMVSRSMIPSMVTPSFASSEPSLVPYHSPQGFDQEAFLSRGAREVESWRDALKKGYYRINPIYGTPPVAPHPPTSLFTMSTVTVTRTVGDCEGADCTEEALEATPAFISPSSSAYEEIQPTPTLPLQPSATPTLEPTSPSKFDKAPVINRRIPKLTAIAGKLFQYQIPKNAFFDEIDGDTRSLKLNLFLAQRNLPLSDEDPPFIKKNDGKILPGFWLKFDPKSQTLKGYPHTNHVARHYFIIRAENSKGQFIEDVIEIHVRQHTKSRVFNHVFTLNAVQWNRQKFPTLVDGLGQLIKLLSVNLFEDPKGGAEGSSIVLTDYRRLSVTNTLAAYTVSWTNETLLNTSQGCPIKEIQAAWRLMTSAEDDGETEILGGPVEIPVIKKFPSNNLLDVLRPYSFMLTDRVSLSYTAACGKYSPTKPPSADLTPKVRNSLGKLIVPFGQLWVLQVPEDAYYCERTRGGTRDLDLSLESQDESLSYECCVYFNQSAQRFLALAVDEKDARRTFDLRMIITDTQERNFEATDLFKIEIGTPDREAQAEKPYTFGVSMFMFHEVKSRRKKFDDHDLNIEAKLELISLVARNLLKSTSPFAEMHLDNITLTKHEYLGPKRRLTRETEPVIDLGDEKLYPTRDQRASIYQLQFTNSSILSREGCPVDEINANVVEPLFDSGELEKLNEEMSDEFTLMHVRFRPMGVCHGQMSDREVGHEPLIKTKKSEPPPLVVDPFIPNPTSKPRVTKPPKPPLGSEIEATQGSDKSEPEGDDEDVRQANSFMNTLFPVILAMVVLLVLALIIAIVLYRSNRRQRRKSLEPREIIRTTGISTLGSAASSIRREMEREGEPFVVKGRSPVILDEERQRLTGEEEYSRQSRTVRGNTLARGQYSPAPTSHHGTIPRSGLGTGGREMVSFPSQRGRPVAAPRSSLTATSRDPPAYRRP